MLTRTDYPISTMLIVAHSGQVLLVITVITLTLLFWRMCGAAAAQTSTRIIHQHLPTAAQKAQALSLCLHLSRHLWRVLFQAFFILLTSHEARRLRPMCLREVLLRFHPCSRRTRKFGVRGRLLHDLWGGLRLCYGLGSVLCISWRIDMRSSGLGLILGGCNIEIGSG